MEIKVGDKLEITVVVHSINITATGTSYLVVPISKQDAPWSGMLISLGDILRKVPDKVKP